MKIDIEMRSPLRAHTSGAPDTGIADQTTESTQPQVERRMSNVLALQWVPV